MTAYLAKLANPPAAAEEEEVCSVQAQHSTHTVIFAANTHFHLSLTHTHAGR